MRFQVVLLLEAADPDAAAKELGKIALPAGTTVQMMSPIPDMVAFDHLPQTVEKDGGKVTDVAVAQPSEAPEAPEAEKPARVGARKR